MWMDSEERLCLHVSCVSERERERESANEIVQGLHEVVFSLREAVPVCALCVCVRVCERERERVTEYERM